jgi:hypothetical protein
MVTTKQVQQRFPTKLLQDIDDYAESRGMTRTGAINLMCQAYLDMLEIERLKEDNNTLRKTIVNIAMGKDGD